AMVGLFINTLPVRVALPPEAPLLPWLEQLQGQQVEREQYAYSPLVEIQGWSDVPRGVPLFESLVVFENYPVGEALIEQRNGVELRVVRAVEWTNYPLTVVAAVLGAELGFKVIYDSGRFEAATIERLGAHFETLLRGMVAQPEQRLAELPLLPEAEWRQMVAWNTTEVEYPKGRCIHQLFGAQVKRTPAAIAAVFENEQLTYRELNRRANQLAHYLRQLGVGPEVLVSVFMERSLEMVIGLYGILKAGGAYVPIDPEYPAERVAFMVQDSQAPVLLTQQRLVERLPQHGAYLICLDTDWPVIAREPGERCDSGVVAENLAYMIYTSGSTGRPKGAMNTHRGLCNRLLWMQETYQLTASDRVLQKTPFSFDVSVWEFFWPLLAGARLVVARPEGHKDSAYLAALIVEQGITTLHFVPSMLQVFLQAPGVKPGSSLKRVICSGEALPFDLQERFFKRLSAQLHNLYGPTEAAIDVTFWECQPQGNRRIVPIGRPVANTQIYMLDAHLQPVPIGVPGELHIGGVQVGRGYLNRPELTAEKFIKDPFS
ncbi:MAG: amino acid adenylation domain-containing protein, partial [Acidobacteria bacterium]|nr:amino acid adenylation domain-containing protein [Acidobacteriota bacterium]